VTSGKIADGTIVNADINASAAIEKTKISGTAITAADTGTVTSAMLASSSVTKAKLGSDVAKIIQVQTYKNSTRTALPTTQSSGAIMMWTVTFNKLSSTSILVFNGILPGHHHASGALMGIASYGTSPNTASWGYIYESSQHVKLGVINGSIHNYTTTGSQSFNIGYHSNGAVGDRPFVVWNPNTTDDGRLTQAVSSLTIMEVEP